MGSPFGLNRRSLAFAVAPTLLMITATGCHHRRSSLRPVYVAPAPATLVPENCPPATTTTTPGFEDHGEPASLSPAAPAGTPSRLPGPAEEPPLTTSPPSPTSGSEPTLQAPSASNNTRRRRAAPRAALRTQVQPYVNDADDLFVPPKADRPWKYIVLHHSAHASGSYAQIDRDHRQVHGWNGCGYHFVIGNGSESPDGQIEVAQRWSEQKGGTHCRNGRTAEVNDYGIGICLIGDLDNAPPTPRQVEAAKALVAYLRDRYTIPPDHVGTHALLASGPTACPGRNFPTTAILGSRSLASR
jgi:hypothetical protein